MENITNDEDELSGNYSTVLFRCDKNTKKGSFRKFVFYVFYGIIKSYLQVV